MATEHHEDPSKSTREWIDLKIGSMRSEMRTLFILSVAGNQLLAHLSLSTPAVAYIFNGLLIGGVIAIKVSGFFLKGFIR